MRIVNAIFGRKKGDIEQTFIDYIKCLVDLGCDLTVLTYQDAPILNMIPSSIPVKTIANFGQWDPVASWKLKKIIRDLNPSVILAHGNRSGTLLSKSSGDLPIVGVCHNYNVRQVAGCNAFITVTEEVRRSMIRKGHHEDSVFTVPHMMYVPAEVQESEVTRRDPIVIGSMGRFVAKKGFNVFLKALSILKTRDIKFKAILAGDGTELEKMKAMAKDLMLHELVEFTGWVDDKSDFFSKIDIFCLPSLHEPVGLVILEAFLHTLPVITTDTEGPMSIVRPHLDALMIEAGEASSMADAIEKLIRNPAFATKLAREGFRSVTSNYESKAVGKKLYTILEKIISHHHGEAHQEITEEDVTLINA